MALRSRASTSAAGKVDDAAVLGADVDAIALSDFRTIRASVSEIKNKIPYSLWHEWLAICRLTRARHATDEAYERAARSV
jgi:hypothetical protein